MEEERKVSVITDKSTGKIQIADEVVAIIADLAISDVKGAVLSDRRKNKRYGKNVNVRIDGNDVYCDIAIVLKNGYKAKQVALPIQQKIKASIENMLEMNVKEVNVCIVGIQKAASDEAKAKERK